MSPTQSKMELQLLLKSKKHTENILFRLFTVKRPGTRNSYTVSIKNISDGIVSNSASLMKIEKQLNKLSIVN
jgi:hypothetical protein